MSEWQALERHAHITRMEWSGRENLTVFTDMLSVVDPRDGDEIPVGEFAIKINFAAPQIRVSNLTDRRGEYDHPHVNNGAFCVGEVEPNLHRLMRQREVAAAVNLGIRALQHVVPDDDYGRHIQSWIDQPATGSTSE